MKFSTILKKAVMAATGLGLVGFLITHLLGNLQLPAGARKFNDYALMLEHNPMLIIPAELGLIAIFVVHIYLALKLTLENKEARPDDYAGRKPAGQSTFASRHMLATGFVILVFVVIHVAQFKYGAFGARPVTVGDPHGSLWDLVIQAFSSPAWSAFYIVCMLIMGFHLSHGIGSMFQSLGLRNASGRPTIKGAAPALGWGIAIGFALLPLWVLLFHPQPSETKSPVNSAVVPADEKKAAR